MFSFCFFFHTKHFLLVVFLCNQLLALLFFLVITHRVVSNSSAMGEFITKGDANEENDMNPVTYNQYMGKMVRSIPKIGGIVQTITGGSILPLTTV